MFIFYAWFQLDDPLAFDINTKVLEVYASGSMMVLELFIFLLLFAAAAFIYVKTGQFSRLLWFLICGYLVVYIFRISLDLREVQEGFNLLPGYVIISVLPFTFLRIRTSRDLIIPISLGIFCVFWLALIGSRTGSASILIFLIALYLWPWIVQTRRRHTFAFFGLCIGITLLYFAYFIIVVVDPSAAISSGSIIWAFNKSIGSRLDIWAQLVPLIREEFLFGYGTDKATMLVSPYLEIARLNLDSHSLYLEILYRLGLVGLLLFVFAIFMLWRLFWIGRGQWVTRVAEAYLVALLLFSTTGDFIVFTTMSLNAGFSWIMLGIGAGASLLAIRNARRRHQQGMMEAKK
jgi:O-antigen ligase